MRLGPYDILERIGEGGMGEVFKARDSRLDRIVAIKQSKAPFSDRFQREARLIASLNHPNICTLHDVGPDYLVMELVEGASPAGPVPPDEVLRIAEQLIDAIDAAHEKGIVHRDLKPANIRLTAGGAVKVLDFGLAKLAPEAEAAAIADADTISGKLTIPGAIMGTTAYMSPEQAQGKPVDKRTDIWAFGVILYELLTGRSAFQGPSTSDTIAAVLTRDPDFSSVPARFVPLLRRCLERDPRRRLRDIADARILLADPPAATTARATPWLPWTAAAVCTAGLAASLWAPWRVPQPGLADTLRLPVDLGAGAIDTAGLPALSPDGTVLVFAAKTPDGVQRLIRRRLDTQQDTVLDGTEKGALPFFSPDGKWIGFSAGTQLKKVSSSGGMAVRIADLAVNPLGASWAEDDTIVFGSVIGGLRRVPASGGEARPLTITGQKGDATHRHPWMLPGGKVALFTSHKIVTGFDDATIEAVTLATGDRKVVLHGGYAPQYVSSGDEGYLVYVHEGVLFAVRFDPVAVQTKGTAVPVEQRVAGNPGNGDGNFALSGSGTLIYRSGAQPVRTWPIMWLDASGKVEPLLAEPGAYYTPRLSSDGSRLALAVDFGERGREIAVYDFARGGLQRLTFTHEVNVFPVWTPDRRYIVFESSSPNGYGLGAIRADGSGVIVRLLENPGLAIPGSFSPDGTLVYFLTNPETGFDLWTARFTVGAGDVPALSSPRPFLRTPFNENQPAFSPDGRWIAFTSNESGNRSEVYVRPYPGPGGNWRVSLDGATNAMWGPDGRSLYFHASGQIMVAEYTVSGQTFTPGRPRAWTDTKTRATAFGRDQTVGPDGRFAFLAADPPGTPVVPGHLTFVLNFFDALRRQVR